MTEQITFQFEHFFELSADLLCIAGFDGYFKRINPSVSKLLEYTEEELYSTPINDFVHPDDLQRTILSREGIKKNIPLLNFENRYITKSGQLVWLSWTSMPNSNDKLVYAIAKNITHKKKHEEERNQLLTNLTKTNKEFKQFTYTTSHDLRSPVNNLLSIFSLLDITKIKDQKTVELLNILKLASERLSQTVNNYVDVVIEKDNLNLNSEELDLEESLNEVLNSIHSLIQNSKTTIEVDFSELKKVHFNKLYLQSIFLNLITNSIKYSKLDCLPYISIYTAITNGTKQLIISDNGIGFDMDKVKDKVFGLHEKFHDHADSKGIGLYLVHNHITSLGGNITLESKVNEGSKIVLSFRD